MTSEVKSGQSSCGQENAYLTNRMQKKFWICITASELRTFEIFNLASEVKFDLGGQKSSRQKLAYLTKGIYIKEIVLISNIVCKLWTFEIFSLASEVIFDLGGQRSYFEKGPGLIKEFDKK